MYFVDDSFISGDFIWSVFFIPLDPFAPLLDGFFPVKLSGDRESGDGVDACVEVFTLFAVLVFFVEDLLDFMLIGFDLSEF
jgi:hypothetical protein